MSSVNFIFYLPTSCAMHNTTAPVIAVELFMSGYYPIFTSATPDQLNHGALPEDVADAALAGSMFGWDTPAAQAAMTFAKEQLFLRGSK